MTGNKKTEIKSRIGFNRTNGNPAFIRSSLVPADSCSDQFAFVTTEESKNYGYSSMVTYSSKKDCNKASLLIFCKQRPDGEVDQMTESEFDLYSVTIYLIWCDYV